MVLTTAKSQYCLTRYYRSFMAVTYFIRSYSHVPIQDLRSLHIPPPHPKFFTESAGGISYVHERSLMSQYVACTTFSSSLLQPGLLGCLESAGWCYLLAPLPVPMSSAAFKIRLYLSTEHFLIPERCCASIRSHLHCGYFLYLFKLLLYFKPWKCWIGPCNCVMDQSVPNILQDLTEFVGGILSIFIHGSLSLKSSNTGNQGKPHAIPQITPPKS